MHQVDSAAPTINTIEWILRDPAWQGIGVVVALLLGLISIWLARRQYKDMYASIESVTAITSAAEGIQNELQMLHDGDELDDAKLVLLKLKNTGSAPITPTDFDGPIRILVDSDNERAKIVHASVVHAKPQELAEVASLEFDAKTANLSPLLLNRGDSITVKLITNIVPIEESKFGYSGMSIKGRITGLKQIRNVSKFSVPEFIGFMMFTLGFGLCFYLAGALIVEFTTQRLLGRAVQAIGGFMFLGLSLTLVDVVLAKLRRRFPILVETMRELFP